MIAMVVAVSSNGVIGRDNDLPWVLPTDLRFFRDLTAGKTIVMGKTTFESILAARAGKPLPNRRNVVLTRDTSFSYPGVEVIHSVDDIASISGDIYIIGGGQVYAATMGIADTLYLTDVHAQIDGGTHFPAIKPSEWKEVAREPHAADDENEYDFDFVTYKKAT